MNLVTTQEINDMKGSNNEFRRQFGSVDNITELFADDINNNIAATGLVLRKKLDKVLLRRSYNDLASDDLPPRTDIDVFCELSDLQSAEYEHVQRKLFG